MSVSNVAYGQGVLPLDLPFSRALHDRAAHLRADPDLIDRIRCEPTTRTLVLWRGRLAVTGVQDRRPALLPAPDADGAWFFLGTHDGVAYCALALPDDDGTPDGGVLPVPDGADSWVGLRELARDQGPSLATADGTAVLAHGLAVEATALARWHSTHVRCPRCGAATVVVQSGWSRRCTADGSEHYPRTDPAVIMAVVDDAGRILLGHAAAWPDGRYSTLAGYVEPGEALEDAVRREVAEETGITVGGDPGDVVYRGSQPWPFPASLMLGFRARAVSTEISVDDDEVTDARWFTRESLHVAAASGDVGLPGRQSIARALIEEWYGGELPGSWG